MLRQKVRTAFVYVFLYPFQISKQDCHAPWELGESKGLGPGAPRLEKAVKKQKKNNLKILESEMSYFSCFIVAFSLKSRR